MPAFSGKGGAPVKTGSCGRNAAACKACGSGPSACSA